MVRQWQTFSAVLGRRAAVKYAGLGLLAAVTSACGGRPERSEPGARPTVAARAVEAFARGTWTVEVDGETGQLTIDSGRWTLTPGLLGRLPASGDYSLSGDTLRIVRRYSDEDRRQFADLKDETYTGTGIPQQLAESGSVQVGWSFEAKQQDCPVTWDGKTLRVSGHDWYGRTILVNAIRT